MTRGVVIGALAVLLIPGALPVFAGVMLARVVARLRRKP